MLNPLDAICNQPREDAYCINQLINAREVDQGIVQARPDFKIFLPFGFLTYKLEEVFQANTYNRFLGALILFSYHIKYFVHLQFQLQNEHRNHVDSTGNIIPYIDKEKWSVGE